MLMAASLGWLLADGATDAAGALEEALPDPAHAAPRSKNEMRATGNRRR
jgi:hypothetical protein